MNYNTTKTIFMKTNQTTLFVIVTILLIAILTNPSQEEHKEKVIETYNTYYQNSLEESHVNSENVFASLGSLLSKTLISTMIENAITRENYVVFSLTKITYEGKEKSIGYGVFGTVILSEKIEEAFNKKTIIN